MTNKEESRLSMYLTFKEYLAAYASITNGLPNFQANSATFLNTVPQIQSCSELQKISKKGVTEGKNQLRETLVVLAADYFRKLGTYALFTGNSTMAKELKIPESKLRLAADTAVKDYARSRTTVPNPYCPRLPKTALRQLLKPPWPTPSMPTMPPSANPASAKLKAVKPPCNSRPCLKLQNPLWPIWMLRLKL